MAGRWLLDFEVGGSVRRYSTEPTTVVTASGEVLSYDGGLSELVMTLDGLEEEQGVEVTDRRFNWAILAVSGHAFERRPARLRFWEPGQLLEESRTILDGLISEPQYGAPGALGRLVFSVRARTGEKLYPPQSAVIDDSTWLFSQDIEQFDPAVEGSVYPTVIGYPGYLQTVSGNAYSRIATPALMARTTGVDTWLILSIGPIEAETVRIYDPDGTDASGAISTTKTAVLNVELQADLVGQAVSVATDFPLTPGTDDLSPVIGHRFYASFRPDSGWGGGIVNGAGNLIRDLPDVLAWVLRNSGRSDVDVVAQESERDVLGSFKVDGFLNEPKNLVKWADDELGKLFPIVRTRTAKGIYWRLIRWDARAVDAIDHIDADSTATRVSAPTSSRKQVANRFSIEYAYVLDTGAYAARRILAPEHQEITLTGGAGAVDERVIGSPLCARSRALFDDIEARPIQTRFIWDFATAGQALHHRALRDAMPRVFVSYQRQDLAHLRRGDVVTVSDSEIGYDRVVALVDSVRLSGSRRHTVNLEILSSTIRAAG